MISQRGKRNLRDESVLKFPAKSPRVSSDVALKDLDSRSPFLSKLFFARKIEKVEVWTLFGIVFEHGNGTIPHFHQLCFQNRKCL